MAYKQNINQLRLKMLPKYIHNETKITKMLPNCHKHDTNIMKLLNVLLLSITLYILNIKFLRMLD